MTTTEAAPLAPGPEAVTQGQPFRMLLALIGTATSDGRVFDELTWRDLPLSVLWQPENLPGHEGAVVVGRLARIIRDGSDVWGYGVLDTVGDNGREVTRQIREQFLKGVSVDAAVLDVEEAADGNMHFRAEIGAVTIVAFPAFRETQIELEDAVGVDLAASFITAQSLGLVESRPGVGSDFHGVGLIASAARPGLPASWFTKPELHDREGLHVEADGRVWGRIYHWGDCHTGSPRGQCVQASPSRTDYAYFLTGHVLTDAGEARTGPIVLSADHAALSAGWLSAKDHYANSALATADVACGDDEYGIWVAGAVRPGVSDDMLHALRASAPSGDWRPIGGALELVAILSVNTPGFPALAASFHDGALTALVASGGPVEPSCGCGGTSPGLQARLEALATETAALRVLTASARASMLEEWDRENQEAREARAAMLEAEVLG